MKGKFNTIEEYNAAYRARLKKDCETEVRLYQNWLDGHRTRNKIGWLASITTMTEEHARERLNYYQHFLDNIDYYVKKNSYNYKKPQTQKDNDLSFVGNGTAWAYSSHIRVPSLKRKSAWKRFYKMFPDLKGMKSIPGKSSCGTFDSEGKWHQAIQHESTIKLKKVKKNKK